MTGVKVVVIAVIHLLPVSNRDPGSLSGLPKEIAGTAGGLVSHAPGDRQWVISPVGISGLESRLVLLDFPGLLVVELVPNSILHTRFFVVVATSLSGWQGVVTMLVASAGAVHRPLFFSVPLLSFPSAQFNLRYRATKKITISVIRLTKPS